MATVTLLTKSYVRQHVAENWLNQYRREIVGSPNGDRGLIYKQLIESGDMPTEDQIAEIIGNRSWTRTQCDICGKDVEELASFRSELINDGMSAAYICSMCLQFALDLMSKANV